MTEMCVAWVLSASALILMVLLLRGLLGKRISAGLRYGLWVVVLVRLLVPVSLFSLSVTVPQIPDWDPPEAMKERSIYVLPVGSSPLEESDVRFSEDGTVDPFGDVSSFGYPKLTQDGTRVVRYAEKISPLELMGWIWVAGAAVMGIVLAASNLRFSRRLRRVRQPLEGTNAPVPVYAASALPSPCLVGLFRPAVYVTEKAAADPVMLRHVLAHELTHYNHRDHLWSVLRGAALAVHWWNPLVWLAVVCSRRDGELACDEGALKRLGGGERSAYGETLLSLVTAKARPADLLSFATTMTGGKRSLKERIQRIAKQPKQLASAMIAVMVVLTLSALVAFGQAKGRETDPLLQPPGLCWNDSVETVIEKLGITEEQIFVNEKDFPMSGYEEWDIQARDVPILGYKATVGFGFVRYEGTTGGYGLERVVIVLPEEADMAAVKAELIARYGAGEAGQMDVMSGWNSRLPDAREPQPDMENHHMLWTAGREALPEGYEEWVRDWLMNVRYQSADPEKIEEYLAEASVATLYWTDDWLRPSDILTTNYIAFDAAHLVEFLQNVPLEKDAAAPQSTDTQTGIHKVDLDHDGLPDMLDLLKTEDAGHTLWQIKFYGSYMSSPTWTGEAGSAHVGWTSFYLCRLDGEDYLLQYTPYMGGGSCEYRYKLFYLTTGGKEVVVQENLLEFDLIFAPDYEHLHQYDPEAINAFMEEINTLLASSEQLVNTDENLLGTFQKEGRLYDSLWWLDDDRDEKLSLLENLKNYGNYAQDHPDDTWSPLADLLLGLTAEDILLFDGDQSALVGFLKSAERGSRFYAWDSYEEACEGAGAGEADYSRLEIPLTDGSTLWLLASSERPSVLMILEMEDEAVSAFYTAPELKELIIHRDA